MRKIKLQWFDEMISDSQDRTEAEAEAMLYEDAFFQWLREHAQGQDVHEFFKELEESSFSTAYSVEELFAVLGWSYN